MSKVILSFNGVDHEVDYDACVNMMDDDIREQVHDELAPCTDQEFLDRYCQVHCQVFGEEFQI